MNQEDYELSKDDYKCAFEILRQSGRWTPSQIKKMMREPKGLRDDFASAALTGLLANKFNHPVRGVDIAHEAFIIADSMMSQREVV